MSFAGREEKECRKGKYFSGVNEHPYTYYLIRMIHHCDQKIEQNCYVDDAIAAKHRHPPEPGVTLNS